MAKETSTRTIFLKAVAACVVVGASLGITQIGEYPAKTDSASSSGENLSYTPGTYTGKAAGMDSDVTVTATFDEGSITDLTVDVSGETAGIGAEIGDEMTQKFLDAQSSAVDAASGATVTSDALKAALDDCIAQATGEGGSVEESESEPAEIETEAEAIIQSRQQDEITESEAASGVFVPGVYSSTVEGAQGDISIAVTFTSDSIVGISYDLSAETSDMGAGIGPEMSAMILEAQSANVDGVTGATVTSDAFKAGVDACIEQAEVNEGSFTKADLLTGPGPVIPDQDSEISGTGYVPGTYTATAEGNGEVTVSVLFDESEMLSISYDLSSDDKEAAAELCSAILDAQSTDVDDILDFELTSEAFKTAVEDCMEQAKA